MIKLGKLEKCKNIFLKTPEDKLSGVFKNTSNQGGRDSIKRSKWFSLYYGPPRGVNKEIKYKKLSAFLKT